MRNRGRHLALQLHALLDLVKALTDIGSGLKKLLKDFSMCEFAIQCMEYSFLKFNTFLTFHSLFLGYMYV